MKKHVCLSNTRWTWLIISLWFTPSQNMCVCIHKYLPPTSSSAPKSFLPRVRKGSFVVLVFFQKAFYLIVKIWLYSFFSSDINMLFRCVPSWKTRYTQSSALPNKLKIQLEDFDQGGTAKWYSKSWNNESMG